jgi:predicted nuclease with TOPRIM domain
MLDSVNHHKTCRLRRDLILLIPMSTAREILEARLAALNAEMPQLKADLAKAYENALRLQKRVQAASDEINAIRTAVVSLVASEAKPQRISIMDAIMETLRDKPEGMTAREMLTELNLKYFDGGLARHSLSPQLSRLKDRDGKIEYRNERWIALPDRPTLFSKEDRRL